MEELNELSKQFLSCNSLKNFHFRKSILDISWEEQKQLLSKTVHHPLVLEYPLSYPYQRSFLRSVIHGLESAGVDVHDEVYESYTSLLGASTTEYVYKHYVISPQVTVTLKESSRLISDGTTGLHSWEAAVVLAEWCIQNGEKLKNKYVIELGSGAGLTGLTVGKCCAPSTLWLTDCHPTVLSLLKDNLELNFSNDGSVCTEASLDDKIIYQVKTNDGNKIGVMNVSWQELPSPSCHPHLSWPDVVLAADVVYDASLFHPLCASVSYYLNPAHSLKPPLVLFVCTVRNQDTLQEFIQMLDSYRIHHTEVDLPTPLHFSPKGQPDDPPIRIYQLTSTPSLS